MTMRRALPCLLLAALVLSACTDASSGRGYIVSSPHGGHRSTPTSPASPSAPPGPPPPADIPTETHTGKGNGGFTTAWPAGQPGYLTFDCPKCGSNIVIETDGEPFMPVNAIGRYHGTTWFNVPFRDKSVKTVTVSADAAWTATIADHRSLPQAELGKPMSGKGDTVLKIPPGAKSVKIAVKGEDHFAAWMTVGDTIDLVLNDIGTREVEVPMTGPAYLELEAWAGSWTVTPS